MVDIRKTHITSDRNYMKRSDFCGNDTVTLGGFGTFASKVVTHGLDYIPFFEVAADIDNDGTIWAGNKVHEYTETSLSGFSLPYPELDYWIDEAYLTVGIRNESTPTSSGSRRLWWLIYLDYGTE